MSDEHTVVMPGEGDAGGGADGAAPLSMGKVEEHLKELENLSRRLQEGKLTLDEAIAAYARGQELVVSCHHTLEALERQVAETQARTAKLLNTEAPAGTRGRA